jgi:hypothetical protein
MGIVTVVHGVVFDAGQGVAVRDIRNWIIVESTFFAPITDVAMYCGCVSGAVKAAGRDLTHG